MSYQAAIQHWREGERRVDAAADHERPAVERVVERLVAELRRRLGSSFTTDELADLYYGQGTAWCFDIATSLAPAAPWAWDARVFDAAFARYVRGATDFAGGRRLDPEPD